MSRGEFVSSKRSRVQGTGPDRKFLPDYQWVMALPPKVIAEIKALTTAPDFKNDIYGDSYSVSKFCDLRRKIPQHHANFLLQKPNDSDRGMDQKQYKTWDSKCRNGAIQAFFSNYFPNSYRARIAILPPNSEIDWHIDMNTKVSCRLHALIENKDFVFEIDRKGTIKQIPFEPGQIFFTNTAYPHRVYNRTDRPRVSLLFDIDFEDISHLLRVVP